MLRIYNTDIHLIKKGRIIDMKMIFDELKDLNHWVGFKTVNGKKVPVSPNFRTFAQRANVNSSDTWGSYESAVNLVSNNLAEGVGFVNTKKTGLVFIDIDYHADGADSSKYSNNFNGGK